jgi:GNAT superfamily N-acetyltransferase/CRP-like cAMP-binding protein
MNIREIREEDIQKVIELFRANYGDDYAVPEFYDPQWVKRGIYSDNIIWLVIEEGDAIVASGAAILDFGDYNDQIAEIGRLVVNPGESGRGLGRKLLDALVDASDERVEFAFGEARTTHPKTQKMFDHVGLAPLGFLPMAYTMAWRESWVLSGQLFGNGRRLRQVGAAQVIPEVLPLAQLSLRNLGLDEPVTSRPDSRAYPIDQQVPVEPLTGASLVRLLKIEHGRVLQPEVFGGLHIDQGFSQLRAHKATYLVANEGADTLGAVGYVQDEASRNVRIIELIAQEDVVKGSLLRRAVEQAEQVHEAEAIDCEVSAYSPRIQRTLLDLGFLPAAYIPGMVFHGTSRWDVVKMMKLNVAWDLGPMQLVDSARQMFDVVTPAFIRADAQRSRMRQVAGAGVFSGLTALEADFVQAVGEEVTPEDGGLVPADTLHLILAGNVTADGRSLGPKECFGAAALLGQGAEAPAVAGSGVHLLRLTPAGLDALSDRHPRLGLRLYRNLAACAKREDAPAPAPAAGPGDAAADRSGS